MTTERIITQPATRIINEIVLRLAAKRSSGCTEGELLFFLKAYAALEISNATLRSALALLICTGEVKPVATGNIQAAVYFLAE